ncbi:PP2C family protein-serine/threonine phosphatase [Leptospira sp. GIMC2001]|uniref:PP2C family protein-serine/threonine phosphatase n=1 Tax=Leptospira sp. GIMC2001 TaxID=1513297 RepID=UPI0023495161|nr:GAF domain-containing SpoIIE family protein phosphatase [Leptospira sp. GIMC2001]WCL49350.1 SpoIIE family protein phosphatase [Leptospira sp. GIMC2001]
MKANLPPDEEARLAELKSFQLLDSATEQDFDDLVKVASQILQTPTALISLVDSDRQWFKAKVGMELDETNRDIAFCAHAILDPKELLVVPDATKDKRFSDNPLVTGSNGIRFYLGAPLITQNGHAIGTLCAIDRIPREINQEKMECLRILAKQTMAQIELRLLTEKLADENIELAFAQNELARYHSRISSDLENAIEIQNSLMPTQYPTSDEFIIHSYYKSMDEVGGDAIGVYQPKDGDYFDIFFSDVSGHGISASLVSAMSLMIFNIIAEDKLTPSQILNNMHDKMISLHSIHHFISCCYARYIPSEKKLQYSYGGHYPILLYRNGELLELPGVGTLLLTQMPPDHVNYDIQLEPGDKLFFISDGFFDVFNSKMEQLGWKRIKDWILEHSSNPEVLELGKTNKKPKNSNVIISESSQVRNDIFPIGNLVDRVINFANGDISDDMTLLVLEIN